MNEPILVILAAGMGSRFGGLKQIAPLGPHSEILMDYSLFDARRAGFKRVCFIIKQQDEAAFHEAVGRRMSAYFEICYAYQALEDIPAPYQISADRVKPLGTAHALWAARSVIDAPFCILNADDYYGQTAFRLAYDYLSQAPCPGEAAMVPYILKNTLSEHGHVARGICELQGHELQSIVERTMIRPRGEDAEFSLDQGETWTQVSAVSAVSMNFWCFHESFLELVGAHLTQFLETDLAANPIKAEYLLPNLVGTCLQAAELRVQAFVSPDKWFGVTYQEDRPIVVASLAAKHEAGVYPTPLWK